MSSTLQFGGAVAMLAVDSVHRWLLLLAALLEIVLITIQLSGNAAVNKGFGKLRDPNELVGIRVAGPVLLQHEAQGK